MNARVMAGVVSILGSFGGKREDSILSVLPPAPAVVGRASRMRGGDGGIIGGPADDVGREKER